MGSRNRRVRKGARAEMKSLAAALVIGLLWLSSAEAAVPEAEAVHAIMGEARGESYAGKLALAEAIRNRGHLGGVYGVNVPMAKLVREKPKTWDDARRAWA